MFKAEFRPALKKTMLASYLQKFSRKKGFIYYHMCKIPQCIEILFKINFNEGVYLVNITFAAREYSTYAFCP